MDSIASNAGPVEKQIPDEHHNQLSDEQHEQFPEESVEKSVDETWEHHEQVVEQSMEEDPQHSSQVANEHPEDYDADPSIDCLDILALTTCTALPALLFPYSPGIVALAPTYLATAGLALRHAHTHNLPLGATLLDTTAAFALLAAVDIMPCGAMFSRAVVPFMVFYCWSYMPRVSAIIRAEEGETAQCGPAKGWERPREWEPAEQWEPVVEPAGRGEPGDWERPENWVPPDNWEP